MAIQPSAPHVSDGTSEIRGFGREGFRLSAAWEERDHLTLQSAHLPTSTACVAWERCVSCPRPPPSSSPHAAVVPLRSRRPRHRLAHPGGARLARKLDFIINPLGDTLSAAGRAPLRGEIPTYLPRCDLLVESRTPAAQSLQEEDKNPNHGTTLHTYHRSLLINTRTHARMAATMRSIRPRLSSAGAAANAARSYAAAEAEASGVSAITPRHSQVQAGSAAACCPGCDDARRRDEEDDDGRRGIDGPPARRMVRRLWELAVALQLNGTDEPTADYRRNARRQMILFRLGWKPRVPDAIAAPAVASDALLSLPPEVLDEILTRLNLRDAVRTSALSRAWRRRWESLPSLDIDIRCDPQDGQQALWTVDCVLPRCSGRVRRFRIWLEKLSARRLDDWLLFLSRRGGVEDLELSPEHPYKFFSLHSTIFSWHRLISIDLFACHIPPLPLDFVGFPDLKVLSLCNVKLQQNGEYQLEKIIGTSPLLEDLILSELYIGEDEDDLRLRALAGERKTSEARTPRAAKQIFAPDNRFGHVTTSGVAKSPCRAGVCGAAGPPRWPRAPARRPVDQPLHVPAAPTRLARQGRFEMGPWAPFSFFLLPSFSSTREQKVGCRRRRPYSGQIRPFLAGKSGGNRLRRSTRSTQGASARERWPPGQTRAPDRHRARARPAAPSDNLTFFSTRVMLSFPHQSTMEISRLEFAPRPSSSWLRRARSGTRSRVPVPPFSATVCLPPPPVATAKKTVVKPTTRRPQESGPTAAAPTSGCFPSKSAIRWPPSPPSLPASHRRLPSPRLLPPYPPPPLPALRRRMLPQIQTKQPPGARCPSLIAARRLRGSEQESGGLSSTSPDPHLVLTIRSRFEGHMLCTWRRQEFEPLPRRRANPGTLAVRANREEAGMHCLDL
ncbi:hypothetical protein HU200_037667 [Digitaria exilis]|uniref:F-box domain-containing protein n=1 Tax=Digitaria exilis TaxID=1010633 RepID=A0A835BCS2_9POAL|nr:hypothetical protein HU200_037667 [Digitaria exilis]